MDKAGGLYQDASFQNRPNRHTCPKRSNMNSLIEIPRSLTPEKVMEDFRKHGVELDYEQAVQYLDLIYFLASVVVDQNFK